MDDEKKPDLPECLRPLTKEEYARVNLLPTQSLDDAIRRGEEDARHFEAFYATQKPGANPKYRYPMADKPIKGLPNFLWGPSGYVGQDTGRTRYRIICALCGQEVHPATTGPDIMMKSHRDYDCPALEPGKKPPKGRYVLDTENQT